MQRGLPWTGSPVRWPHSWPGGLPNCSLMSSHWVDVRTDAYTFHGGKYVKQKGKDINLIIRYDHRYVKYTFIRLNEGLEEIHHNACICAIWNVSPIFPKISIKWFSFLHNFQKSHNLEMHLRNPWAQNSH